MAWVLWRPGSAGIRMRSVVRNLRIPMKDGWRIHAKDASLSCGESSGKPRVQQPRASRSSGREAPDPILFKFPDALEGTYFVVEHRCKDGGIPQFSRYFLDLFWICRLWISLGISSRIFSVDISFRAWARDVAVKE